jgi:hypothetical protein
METFLFFFLDLFYSVVEAVVTLPSQPARPVYSAKEIKTVARSKEME